MTGHRRRAAVRAALIYLYGVVEAGTAAHRLLETGAIAGLDSAGAVFAVEAGGLAAAVSRVPAESFEEEPLNALLADLPRLAPLVVRHEEVIRTLLPAAPAIVPLTFGAVYRDTQRVVELLQERAGEWRRLLARLRDTQEWGVKVFIDIALLRQAAEQAGAALRHSVTEAAAAGPGRAYLLGKQRERAAAAEAARLADRASEDILARLTAAAAEVRRDVLPADHPGAVQLALKAAFLVRQASVDAFRAAAAELEQEYGPQGLRLDVSGPWAPYSFVGAGGG